MFMSWYYIFGISHGKHWTAPSSALPSPLWFELFSFLIYCSRLLLWSLLFPTCCDILLTVVYLTSPSLCGSFGTFFFLVPASYFLVFNNENYQRQDSHPQNARFLFLFLFFSPLAMMIMVLNLFHHIPRRCITLFSILITSFDPSTSHGCNGRQVYNLHIRKKKTFEICLYMWRCADAAGFDFVVDRIKSWCWWNIDDERWACGGIYKKRPTAPKRNLHRIASHCSIRRWSMRCQRCTHIAELWKYNVALGYTQVWF